MGDIIEDLITRVIQREGGYVDNAADAGGPTKFGITLATLHEWRKSPVSAVDVEGMTELEARRIYRARYFTGTGFDQVKDPQLLELLFDYGVNSGVGAPAAALQTVLKREGLYAGPIDGDFGPNSRAALAKVTNWPALFYALKCERYELLLRYVGRRPDQAQFAIGWANRLDQFEERIA